MDRKTCLRKILDCGIVPIIRLDDAEDAYGTAIALVKGGIDVVEVTMAVPDALGVIRSLKARFKDEVAVGAGTVLDSKEADSASSAGADFIVSPNLDLSTVEACKKNGKVAIPGSLTPTEILEAWRAGADIVKVFPAGLMGGPKYIAALKEVFPYIRLLGLGKVNLETVRDYIEEGSDAVGIGAALVDKADIKERRFDRITEKAVKFKALVELGRSARS